MSMQPNAPAGLRQAHGDSADHHHDVSIRRLRWGILLNCAYIALELAAGFWVNSLALLSDAWHNLTDVLGLGIAWFAIRQVRRPADQARTFGYHRAGILAALANALLLAVVTGNLLVEALWRLRQPPGLSADGGVILGVAGAGVLVNGAVAFALRGSGRDLNLSGAFLHMLGDALVSVGVMVAGAVMLWTGWSWPDPVASLLVAGFILAGVWRLIRETVNVLMEGAPRHLDVQRVAGAIACVPGVKGVHHLHLWSLSGELTALSCHVVVEDQQVSASGLLIERIQRELREQHDISHATIQAEVALPSAERPLPIHHNGTAIRT